MSSPLTALQEIEAILDRTATLSKDEFRLRELAIELDQARKHLGANQSHRLFDRVKEETSSKR